MVGIGINEKDSSFAREKVEVIKKSKDHPGITVRSIAKLFNCGKTQIRYNIMKNKDSILALYESISSTSKQGRASKFSDVNEALCLACSKKVYPVSHNL